jgi:hypothetical protein
MKKQWAPRCVSFPKILILVLAGVVLLTFPLHDVSALKKGKDCFDSTLNDWIYGLLQTDSRSIIVIHASNDGLAHASYLSRRLADPVLERMLPIGTIRKTPTKKKSSVNVPVPQSTDIVVCVRKGMRDTLMKSGVYEQLSVSPPTQQKEGHLVTLTHRSSDLAPQDVVAAQHRLESFINAGKASEIFAECLLSRADHAFSSSIRSSAKVKMLDGQRVLFVTPVLKALTRTASRVIIACSIMNANGEWLQMGDCPSAIRIEKKDTAVQTSYFISSDLLWQTLKNREIHSSSPISLRLCSYISGDGNEAYFEICNQYVEYGSAESPQYCYWKQI